MIFDGEDKRPEQHPNSCEGEGGPVNLKTSTRVVNGIVIVDIIGQLRLGEGTNVVRDLVRDLMGKSYKNILLNLADVRHIDSAGVGELIHLSPQSGRSVQADEPQQECPQSPANYQALHRVRRGGRRGQGDPVLPVGDRKSTR